MLDDKFSDFCIVVEQASPNEKIEILDMKDNPNGLSYLRFRACLQSFIKRNRNNRLWQSGYMKIMMSTPEIRELLNAGGVPGENGHPIPAVGQVTMERILTIDPNNLAHITKEYQWERDDSKVYGIIETLDEGPGSAGYKFMKNILQGMDPSFSTRSIIPQRKNRDGTIDVTGVGRFVTHDRVILPSHEDAYIDKSIPVQNIVSKSKFETVMESYVSFVVDKSDKVNRIIDTMSPAVESATIDKTGMVSVPTKSGIALIYPESKYRNELKDFMKSL
jgi:hypothetical protein